jgi:hypothetical protein
MMAFNRKIDHARLKEITLDKLDGEKEMWVEELVSRVTDEYFIRSERWRYSNEELKKEFKIKIKAIVSNLAVNNGWKRRRRNWKERVLVGDKYVTNTYFRSFLERSD